jgi:gliding motility-associated-like protein
MKKHYSVIALILITLCFSNIAKGQLVGGQGFIRGAYLEIGELTNGAFGTTSSPVGYHPHFGPALAEVYDYGHDGWAVGSPPYMGDYTYPGSPFEGWEIQMNSTRMQQYVPGGYTPSGACTMTGTGLTSYTNSGGSIRTMWGGNFNQGATTLVLRQETRVDTFASAVTVTCKIYNTSATAATGVYYWRSCDPDNDETWPGGTFTTNNYIDAQNDVDHRVSVTAIGRSSTLPPLTLCTKDARAVAVIYNSWGLTVTQDLAAVWNQTYGPPGSGAYYGPIGTNHPGDIGIGLVYKLGRCPGTGSIAAGDSDVISYAYVFNGHTGIDSIGAFPEPSVSIGGGTIVHPPAPYPNTVLDTYNACANPGISLVPVDLPYADETGWTWSDWTWSPGTGLSATTGAHVIVNVLVLPASITYTVTGTDPWTCQTRTMLITFITCNKVRSNSPCYGDTLFLDRVGDSTGCTYLWWGPPGFTSTLQNPFIYPATYADSTKFFVKRTVSGVSDTDSIAVRVHYKPVVTASNNSPLCLGIVDTLLLDVNPGMAGMTYTWSGPPAFTSTLKNPSVQPFIIADVGTYTVVVTSPFGCKDTATTYADTITQPPMPYIDSQQYCQGSPFIPWTVHGIIPGGTLLWYANPTGGTPIAAPAVPTGTPGYYTYYYSQRNGSCESNRNLVHARVVTTPAAPGVSGTFQYCQHILPFFPLTLSLTTTGVPRWYTVATGGSFTTSEPIPDLNTFGTYHYWVSQFDSGCEGPRTPVTIIVHKKPAKPTVVDEIYCQFNTPHQIQATVDGTDPPEVLKYYGPGVPPGTTIAPTPNTSTAPDTSFYYVTETTTYGCISDSAKLKIITKWKPDAPTTHGSRYCQHDKNPIPLNFFVDSLWNSTNLSWYKNATLLGGAPTPNTETSPGFQTWWVSQWVNGCQGDSTAIRVEIVYKPVFSIEPSAPFVCQFDSLRLAYKGPPLFEPFYYWTLPGGAKLAAGANVGDSMITVAFDSANLNNYVKLRAFDDSGFCYSDTTLYINVVSQPTLVGYTKPDVCLGDTIQLALTSRSDNAYSYKWYIDDLPMANSHAVDIVTSNSNSGGPFMISWVDSGRHIITIQAATKEGCVSPLMFDSVEVHSLPDAVFAISSVSSNSTLCLDDSMQFTARTFNYNNLYEWAPADYFHNDNKPVAWGRLRQDRSIITLRVTDPFGCHASQDMEIDPGACCTVLVPNAFTPNGSGPAENNTLRPYANGHHLFHVFRVVNRWGQTVFESANNSDAQWDGRYNGVPQDMGVYYYYLKYDCHGKTFEQKGDVTLIR